VPPDHLPKSQLQRIESSRAADIFCHLFTIAIVLCGDKRLQLQKKCNPSLESCHLQCYYHINIYRSRATCEVSPHAILPELVVGADCRPLFLGPILFLAPGPLPHFDDAPPGDARCAFGAFAYVFGGSSAAECKGEVNA
jgi:hypothetical protein